MLCPAEEGGYVDTETDGESLGKWESQGDSCFVVRSPCEQGGRTEQGVLPKQRVRFIGSVPLSFLQQSSPVLLYLAAFNSRGWPRRMRPREPALRTLQGGVNRRS